MGKFKMRIPNPKGIKSPLEHKGDHSNIKNFGGHQGGKHITLSDDDIKYVDTKGKGYVGGYVYPGGHNLVKGGAKVVKDIWNKIWD